MKTCIVCKQVVDTRLVPMEVVICSAECLNKHIAKINSDFYESLQKAIKKDS